MVCQNIVTKSIDFNVFAVSPIPNASSGSKLEFYQIAILKKLNTN